MRIFRKGEILNTSKYETGGLEKRYEVRDLKIGGMSLVYICFDYKEERPVVLKTLKEEYREKSFNRFIKEALIWRELPPHRNIVKAEDVIGVQENNYLEHYLVLEFIAGVREIGNSLRDWIIKKKLDLKRMLNFSIQFCEGMLFAYKQLGLIHLDIKPENILIDRGEIVKITDFGIAKSLLSQSNENFLETSPNEPVSNKIAYTSSGVFIGTIPYSSPEQCLNLKNIDTRSDIYSFGCVMYEMLTNRWIFEAESAPEFLYKHIYEKPKNPRKFNRSIPRFLDSIVMKCLEKDPDRRYPSFESLKKDLNRLYEKITGEKFAYEIKIEEAPAEILARKIDTLLKLNEFEEAEKYADELLRVDPKNPVGLEAKAMSYLLGWGSDSSEGIDYKKALYYYNLIHTYYPGYPGIWYYKGLIWMELANYIEAVKCLDKAIEENPENPYNWWLKGDCLMKLDSFEEALKCYDKALEIYPYFSPVWEAKAKCLEKLGRKEEATECKKKSEIFSSGEYDGLPPHF